MGMVSDVLKTHGRQSYTVQLVRLSHDCKLFAIQTNHSEYEVGISFYGPAYRKRVKETGLKHFQYISYERV